MTCPAREKVKRSWWKLKWEEGQPHDFQFHLEWRSYWWEIKWGCSHCGATYTEWPIDDFQLMRKLGLKKCPMHDSFALWIDKDDLTEQGCY